MSSNQDTTTITPEIGEKIKLIFTTLVDLVIYGVNRMKKEPPVVEERASPDEASSTTTAAENVNEPIVPPMKTGEKINVSTSSLQVNV